MIYLNKIYYHIFLTIFINILILKMNFDHSNLSLWGKIPILRHISFAITKTIHQLNFSFPFLKKLDRGDIAFVKYDHDDIYHVYEGPNIIYIDIDNNPGFGMSYLVTKKNLKIVDREKFMQSALQYCDEGMDIENINENINNFGGIREYKFFLF